VFFILLLWLHFSATAFDISAFIDVMQSLFFSCSLWAYLFRPPNSSSSPFYWLSEQIFYFI
jgi:hypothetical protein